jgi:RNA polymerase sigma-70 factor (ECF subfamily)
MTCPRYKQGPLDEHERDTALVHAIAQGDQAALGQLYDRYAGLMLAVGKRICDAREAEDLIHDVFMEVWQKASTFSRSRGTVRTWLLLRVRSRALDRRRSARVKRLVLVDDCLSMADDSLSMADDAMFRSDRLRIRKAVLELSEEQREVVLPTYFEGLSSAEIAARLGIPTGTVKSRMRAAREKLRALLDPGLLVDVNNDVNDGGARA